MKIKLLLASLLFGSQMSVAVPITYDGELISGVSDTGSVSDPIENADWWYFSASAGDSITLRVDRIDENLDPALRLFSGIQTDTASLSGFLASADDEISHPGPFGDPLLNYNITTTGMYSVQVWDFLSGSGAPFEYEILLRGANPGTVDVAEPSGLALLGLGLVGLGAIRRRSKS